MNGGQHTIGLAPSRNLCRLGESLRPSASAWFKVPRLFHGLILGVTIVEGGFVLAAFVIVAITTGTLHS